MNGGLYGRHPSLTELAGGDLMHSVDFRSVYASVLQSWLKVPATRPILRGDFKPLDLIRA